MKDNHKYLKRFLAFALSVAMVITYMPVNLIAYAETEAPEQPVAEEVVNDTASTEAPAPQEEVKTEEPAPVQEEVTETEPAPVEEPVVTEESSPAEGEQQQAEQPEEVVEETPAEETPEPEEEEAFPAHTFNADKGGVKVLVKAPEGALPEGTEMVVTPANTKAVEQAVKDAVDGEVTGFKAVDITFVKDGEDIQPAVPVHVYLNASGLDKDADKSVVHIADSGVAEVVDDATVNGAGIAKVVTDQFSVYVVVETGSTDDEARATVNFYGKDASKPVATYYVKNSDSRAEIDKIAPDPGAGTLADNEIFKGWTTTQNYTSETEAQNIEKIHEYLESLEIKEGDVVNIYAMIFKAINITYLDGADISLGTETKLVPVNDTNGVDYTVSMAYAPKSSDENFEGWNVASGASNISNAKYNGKDATVPYQNDTTMTIKGDVTFSVNAAKGHWLVFDENGKGATYNAPQFVKQGQNTEKPSNEMTRKGYTFGGWYTDAACTDGNEFTFGSTLEDNTTIYAKWTAAAQADYTILIWKQNVDGKTYDFAESISGKGTVGQNINVTAASGRTYTGFHFKEAETDVKIVPEGSSVANVYYDRNEVTLIFKYRGNRDWVTQETMTGLYGQTLASQGYTWPTNRWWYDSYQSWGGTYSGAGTRTTFLDAFILSNGGNEQTFYGFSGNGSNHIYFYKQDDTEDSGYKLANEVTSSNGTFNISDKYNGYKAASYSTNNRTWTTLGEKDSQGYYASVSDYTNLYIRYDALEYNILYYDGVYVDGSGNPVAGYSSTGKLHEDDGILYDSDVSSYNKGGANYYEPTSTDGFVFDGWYVDDKCTQKYTFSKMPEGITVYAKWVQKQYRVFLHPNAGTDSTLDWGSDNQAMTFRVSNGGKISAPTGLRQEYEFVGWYMDEAMTKVFNADAFVLNDTTVTTPYDKTKDFTDPMDKWGNGATWNADVDRAWITTKFDLYGRWRAKLIGAEGIGVKYDANGGTNAPTDKLLYLDDAGAIAQAASTPPEGKQFLHWVLQTWDADKGAYVDTATEVYPGDSFKVLKANAKVEQLDDSTEEKPHFAYTVQLRAEYGPAKTPTPTHIYWYRNDGTTDTVRKDENLQINQAVTIPGAPSRDNYKFIGWAKAADATTPWIAYENGAYEYEGKTVTQVAADEILPYDDMYAVWAAEVTAEITGSKDSKPYNGSEQSNTNYSVKYFVGGEEVEALPSGVTFTASPASPAAKGTDVGTYDQQVSGTLASTNALYVIPDNAVTTDKTYGGKITLEITKRTVTLTSADGEKKYDGTPLTKNAQTDVTVSGDGFVEGEGATYNITGTQTDVGSSANTFTYTLNEGTKAKNYDIKTVEGTLKVTANTDKVTVTITENSGSATYDGEDHTISGYKTIVSDNDLYDVTTSVKETKTDAWTVTEKDAGSYDMGIVAADFENINNNFSNVEFKVVDGKLDISKRAVTLTSATDSKVYDGTALTNDEVTVGGDGFAKGEGATYDVTGTQTEVGESKNTFTYTLNEGTNKDNYDITQTEGTLTVTELTDKVVVTITEKSGSEKYDGTEKTVTGYTVSISNPLYKESDFTFSGNATVKGTDAGSYPMELKPEDFTNNNKNFSNVEFKIVDGTLEIAKRTVTLTSADGEKVYDGTPLTKNAQTDVTVGGDGFATGEGAKYDITGSQTDVGSSANAFTYTLNEGTKAANYDITTATGTLTVTELTDKVTVTITEHKGSEKYDGAEKTVTGYDVSIDNELYTEADFEFSGNDTVKGTDAGSYPMELKVEDFKNISENFSNVEFKIVDGTLEISKRTVTLTSADGEKVYDGTALTKNAQTDVTVGGDGFATGEGAKYNITGTQTEVGSSKNTFTYELNEGTKADNYTITKTEGTLKVTELTDKVTVTITENSGSEKYDGTEKTVTGYTVSISNPLYTEKDFTFSGNATVKGTDAGTYEMQLKPADFKNTNKNFSNVEFVIVDGKLEISKRTVTMTSADDDKVYDGKALTNDKVTVGGDGFAEGEGATYDVTGTQTNVGSSANKFEYTLNEGTKAANYDITKKEGTLEVTPVTDKVTVTITENSGTAKYDGTEKTVEGYTVKISNPLYTENDFTFDGDATVKGTDAGSYDMELTPEDFTNTSKNFSNVEFVIVDGTLEISKRTVTMTSATDSKTYDGKALTNDEVKETGDGFVEGEGATYDVTGTQTDAGSSKNTFTYTLNKGTKAENYEITQVEGTLTVTADDKEVVVVITENSGSEKYDGTEKTVTGYKVTSISSDLYKESDFTFSGDATVKGTDAGSYDMELKPADFTNNNKNFTKVTFQIVDGTLEISKRTVTLTSATEEKVYDGKALTNDEVTVGGDGFADGEGAKYDVTGTQTDVGSSQNSFSYTLNEGTKADNYDITQSVGTLTVTPVTDKVTVTIKGHKDDVDYNGAEQKVEGYDVSIDNELYTEEDFTFSGDATAKGTDVKKSGDDVDSYPMGLKAGDFENISKNFTNVEFVVNDGSLKIEPIDVTIESASAEKVYDGTPLTKHAVTVDGFVEGEGLAAVKVTGTQTYVGSSENTFEYKLFGDSIFRKMLAALNIDDTDAYDPAENGVTKTTKADNYDITVKYGTLEVTDENVDIDDVATKTHEDKEYKLGETVKFTIEVTNIYDEKKTITVEEQEGVTITSENEFKDVEPGAKVTVTAEYVVTEADLLAGSFSNTATVKFSDVDKPYEPKDDVDVEDPNSHLTVDKKTTSKPANGETYALGETITYEVTATNDGNMTLKNIEVTDELTGDAWTVEELAPGESKTFTAEYTVTEKDIIAGSVKNEATATAEPKDPEAPKPEIVPGTTEDPTDESNPHLTVVKETTSTPANGKEYEVGETVTYEITVTNDGNLTVKDIEVKDDLTGDKWNVESLAPEQSQTFNCEYTITEEDAKNGSVTNIATATGITDDPNHPYPTVVPGEKTVPVVEPADDTKKGVKTGDDNNFGGWLAMMLLAGAGASGLFIRRRREDEE